MSFAMSTEPQGRVVEVTAGQPPMIVANGLTRHFDHRGNVVRAVDGVSFELAPGGLVAITGPSGSGKSTLLSLLGALEAPSSGTLRVAGVDVGRLTGRGANGYRRHQVGFVFQAFHLIPNLSAVENVALPMELVGMPWGRRRRRAAELLDAVGIDSDRFTHRPARLSGGQQQRVAIARALANDPAVILGDEVTGNLDSDNSSHVVQLLRTLADAGRTVLLATHDLAIAERADRWLRLRDGRLESEGPER